MSKKVINKKQFEKWIHALRSGEYKQDTSCLEGGLGFCCLGVACKVLIPEKKQTLRASYIEGKSYLAGSMPEDQASAPAWLKKIDKNFSEVMRKNPFTLNDSIQTSYLTALNDRYRLSFDEIADVLELMVIHNAFGKHFKLTGAKRG